MKKPRNTRSGIIHDPQRFLRVIILTSTREEKSFLLPVFLSDVPKNYVIANSFAAPKRNSITLLT